MTEDPSGCPPRVLASAGRSVITERQRGCLSMDDNIPTGRGAGMFTSGTVRGFGRNCLGSLEQANEGYLS
jgi:hypothetical protein